VLAGRRPPAACSAGVRHRRPLSRHTAALQVASARTFETVPVVEGLWDRGNLGALCRLCDGAPVLCLPAVSRAGQVAGWPGPGREEPVPAGLGIGALHSINTQCAQRLSWQCAAAVARHVVLPLL